MQALALTSGEVVWTQDLNGSTATTPYPSASTDGVEFPRTNSGNRMHVAVRYQIGLGTLSADVHVYGYDSASTARWYYLGSLNNGNAITSGNPKFNPDNSTAVLAEVFSASGRNYRRYATRVISPQGTNPLVSTWIGYENG